MIHPLLKILGILLILIVLMKITIGFVMPNFFEVKNTKEKIFEINTILDNEKKAIGKYPKELEDIIRNNPLRKGINYDFWNNEFHYVQIENGMNYILKSKGRDGILNTEDDIEMNKN